MICATEKFLMMMVMMMMMMMIMILNGFLQWLTDEIGLSLIPSKECSFRVFHHYKCLTNSDQVLNSCGTHRFGSKKDGNLGKLIGSNLVIFCYKEFEKFELLKSISQSEVTFIVYYESIISKRLKIKSS